MWYNVRTEHGKEEHAQKLETNAPCDCRHGTCLCGAGGRLLHGLDGSGGRRALRRGEGRARGRRMDRCRDGEERCHHERHVQARPRGRARLRRHALPDPRRPLQRQRVREGHAGQRQAPRLARHPHGLGEGRRTVDVFLRPLQHPVLHRLRKHERGVRALRVRVGRRLARQFLLARAERGRLLPPPHPLARHRGARLLLQQAHLHGAARHVPHAQAG